ncbi:MAG: aminotransferase class IV [Thermoanaerobaculia bacterium]
MRVPVDAPAVRHGVGLFETMLVIRGRAALADAHFQRLASTAKRLQFAAPQRTEFDRLLHSRVQSLATVPEAAVRIQWLALSNPHDDAASWRMYASAGPIPSATLARRRNGRAASMPRETIRSLPFAKTTSWLVETLALRDALASGADEGLFVDARGRILEGTSTNVFAVSGDRLITAPEGSVLPGTVRAWVLCNAARIGWRVVERPPSREEILGGSFLTGSLTKIVPLRRLDGVACAPLPGPGFETLRSSFRRAAAGRDQAAS